MSEFSKHNKTRRVVLKKAYKKYKADKVLFMHESAADLIPEKLVKSNDAVDFKAEYKKTVAAKAKKEDK